MIRKNAKKYFIPNEENEYQPHALQKASVAVMFVLVGVVVYGAIAAALAGRVD